MKVLFVFTGGTIGSTLNGSHICLDRHKSYILIESYKRKYGFDIDYDVIEPYTELSENNTGLTIKVLIHSVVSNLNSGYDGIIITHGTDTLQYSSAALSYVVGNNSIPICIISSNYPIEHPNSNGLINLYGAIQFIKNSCGKGVWVIYKNNNDYIKVHRATRLLSNNTFSDCLYSIQNSFYGWFDNFGVFHQNECFREKGDEINLLTYQNLEEECIFILRVEPYPGMIYPDISDNLKYILLGSYHSGTINTKSEKSIKFFNECLRRNINVFITGVSDSVLYESMKIFNEFNITPVVNISPISAYMKLWIGSSTGINISKKINCSLSGDIV